MLKRIQMEGLRKRKSTALDEFAGLKHTRFVSNSVDVCLRRIDILLVVCWGIDEVERNKNSVRVQ